MIFSKSSLASLWTAAALSLSTTTTTTQAFTTTFTSKSSSTSTTRLFISSWGTQGPPSRWSGDTLERENPADKVQAYLKEPEAVEARSTIDGTCLVSGLLRPDVTSDDQFLFDLLNHEDSAFEFTKIKCHSADSKFAKKRLLSRSARYTGLLDKLDFVQGNAVLPTAAELQGVKTWLAYLDGAAAASEDDDDDVLAACHQAATIVEQAPSVENIALLLVNANELEASACQAVVDKLKAVSEGRALAFTIVAVGKIEDYPEGREAYQFEPFGSEEGVLPSKAIFSRQESYRMITELLQLEAGSGQALSFAEVYNVNATNVKLIKGLREAGYARPQEIDHMIREGPEAYAKAIAEWETTNPDAAKGYTTNAWWEQEQFQKSRRDSDARAAAKEAAIKDAKTLEIEAIATEWVKREYFRQSMAGTLQDGMTEEEFKETVWERAMLEGDLKYRAAQGEVVDEQAELADFKVLQERKQQAMLKKAKAELAEVLGEDLDDDDDDDEKKD